MESVLKFSNYTIINDIEQLLTHILRSRHYLKLNMSETVRETGIVTMEY